MKLRPPGTVLQVACKTFRMNSETSRRQDVTLATVSIQNEKDGYQHEDSISQDRFSLSSQARGDSVVSSYKIPPRYGG